jgi:hypothetical protein
MFSCAMLAGCRDASHCQTLAELATGSLQVCLGSSHMAHATKGCSSSQERLLQGRVGSAACGSCLAACTQTLAFIEGVAASVCSWECAWLVRQQWQYARDTSWTGFACAWRPSAQWQGRCQVVMAASPGRTLRQQAASNPSGLQPLVLNGMRVTGICQVILLAAVG